MEYLTRVLLYLMAFGGIAALVVWWSSAVEAIYSALSATPGSEETE